MIASGQPIQLDPAVDDRVRRKPTPLSLSIEAGTLDLTRLLLCNGYRQEIEPCPPLDRALDQRRWDLLDLLLDWGADPATADVERVLSSYQRPVFELFWNLGVDLEDGRTMAYVLASATRNRPLYGFVKNFRERDPRIQRGLDTALGHAIDEENEKAVSLCMWAGANPRRRTEDIRWGPEPEEEWRTAIERSVEADNPKLLRILRIDSALDDVQALYAHVYGPKVIETLTSTEPPLIWSPVVDRILKRYVHAYLSEFFFGHISFDDVLGVFDCGARMEDLHRYLKRDLRRVFLELQESDALRLFNVLRDPTKVAPDLFIAFISQEKVGQRILSWSRREGVGREFLEMLATTKGIPGSVKREARRRIQPPPRRVEKQTVFQGIDGYQVFSREDFYELVWDTPLTKIGSRFGMSDNAIRKRCRAMAIPTPPTGLLARDCGGQASQENSIGAAF